MKKKIAVLLSLILVIASVIPAIADTKDNIKGKEEISIIFTHDMHSHLEANNGIGGFSKVATIIKETKKEYPDTLVLDGGDFSMGTPYQAVYQDVASELRMLGFMGYDVTTIGNHEYDHRSAGLKNMLNAAMEAKNEDKKIDKNSRLPEIVLANVDWKTTLDEPALKADGQALLKAFDNYGIKDYTIVEKNGLRIGVFGIFGKEANSYTPLSGLKFLDSLETAKKMVEKLRDEEKVDFTVCVSHSGTNAKNPEKSEDEIMAKEVDGLDMVVSGHSHTVFQEANIINDTLVASAGEYTNNVGHVVFEKSGDKYELKSYEIIPLDGKVVEDTRTKEEIKRFSKLIDKNYFQQYGYKQDQVLTRNDIEFPELQVLKDEQSESALGNLIADSYIYGVKNAEGDKYIPIDVSIAPIGVIRSNLHRGEIRVKDAFNVLSLGIGADDIAGYPLVSVYVTGKELKTAAEVDISVSELMGPARLYMSGLKYTYNPNRLFLNRVTDVKLCSEIGKISELNDEKLYRVVADLYSCQMLGTVESNSFGLLKVNPKDKDGNPITNFDEHIIYAENGMELKEWWALAQYLESFENGKISPSQYDHLQGSKVKVDSHNIFELLKSPNHIFWIAFGVVALIIAIVVLVALLIRKVVKRRHI